MTTATANKPRPSRRLEHQLRGVLAKVYVLLPGCDVCSQRMEPEFLKPFPGAPDVKACGPCIQTCTGEVAGDGG